MTQRSKSPLKLPHLIWSEGMGDNLLYKLCQTRQRAHYALSTICWVALRGSQLRNLDLRCESSLQYLDT